jgi:hypothetical protein
MKKAPYDNGRKRHTIIKTLGITILMLLILTIFAGAGSFADVSNSGSNNHNDLNKI